MSSANFHAVQFLTDLAKIVIVEQRVPKADEIVGHFKGARRGAASARTVDIRLPDLIESFQVISADHLKHDRKRELIEFCGSLANEISARLDDALS